VWVTEPAYLFALALDAVWVLAWAEQMVVHSSGVRQLARQLAAEWVVPS